MFLIIAVSVAIVFVVTIAFVWILDSQKPRYKVKLDNKGRYIVSKKSCKAGETVKVHYPFFATDTDYSFSVTGEDGTPIEIKMLNYDKFSFIMPEQDVKVETYKKNSMVYIDSEFRTDYSNALPYDESEERIGQYYAVCYLGNGEEGKANREDYIKKLFKDKISEELTEKITHYDYGGDDWYLVIPRYRDRTTIDSKREGYEKSIVYKGEPFTLNCGHVAISIDSYGGQEFTLKGKEGMDDAENVWDISGLIKDS